MSERSSAERITWIGLWVNVALFVLKTGAGVLGRSQVLVADGIHSLSDLVSDFITLVALRLGRKPEDERHPYGHGKMEDLAAFLVGIFLMLVALWILWEGFHKLSAGAVPERGLWLVLVALVSVISKELLYRATAAVGRREGSVSLAANAWHHRSDAYSSLATVFGTGLYYVSARFTWADSVSAMIVALLVGKAAHDILREAARDLVDTAPSAEMLASYERSVMGVRGVRGVARLEGRFYSRRVALDVDIEVPGELSVDQGHELAVRVRDALIREYPLVYRVMVHVDPAPPVR